MKQLQDLSDAIQASDIDKVNKLIRAGVDVNSFFPKEVFTGIHSRSPLYLAMEMSNYPTPDSQAVITALIKAPQFNRHASDHRFVLHEAALYGNLCAVTQLIEAGFDVNEQSPRYKGSTPLHLAYDNKKMVQYLLTVKGIDIYIQDDAGNNFQTMHQKNLAPPDSPLGASQRAVLDLLHTYMSPPSIETSIDILIRTVNKFHPTHWYDNKFFRWLQDLFSPVRTMKETVRTELNKQLQSVRDNKNTPNAQKIKELENLIKRFTEIQQHIEVNRQEKEIDGAGEKVVVLKEAQSYLAGNPSTILFSLDENRYQKHSGVKKEKTRHNDLMEEVEKQKFLLSIKR